MQGRKNKNTAAAPEQDSPVLGKLVRALRTRRRMTLEQLAEQAQLSKGHLSRFERGEKTVSVSALMRVAQALHTSVAALLGERMGDDILHVVRSADRQLREASQGKYQFASLSRADGTESPTAFLLRLSGESLVREHAFHAGEEIFFVLSGALEIELASQSVVLRQGDYAQFPGLAKHRLRGIEANTEVLIVVAGSRED